MSRGIEFDESMMGRALALAMKGRGRVEPNPMVGCVIVLEGQIIAEGHHQEFGGPHAERVALGSCENCQGAAAYVTLEPCCHTDKKTPPCVPALVEAGLAKVIIGCLDPNPQVSGKGAAALRDAGIEVLTGVCEAESRQLNAAYFKRIQQGWPYVTLKWAQSADGRVAGPGGKTVWISNPKSTQIVHELRARCDAILVGINTVLADDPLLTARGVERARPLVRAVLDSRLRIPTTSRLIKTAKESPVVVYYSNESHHRGRSDVRELAEAGARVVPLAAGDSGLSLQAMLEDVSQNCTVTHLLVEAGPTLAQSFIHQGLADRIWVFRSPMKIPQKDALRAAQVPYAATGSATLDGDELTEYLNPESKAYFANTPSADLLLAQCAGSTSSK